MGFVVLVVAPKRQQKTTRYYNKLVTAETAGGNVMARISARAHMDSCPLLS